MKIQQVLNKYYPQFLEMVKSADTIIYNGKTAEDILNDTVITIINHYGDNEVEEEEAYEYAKKTFLMEVKMKMLKRGRDKEKLLVFIADYPQNI